MKFTLKFAMLTLVTVLFVSLGAQATPAPAPGQHPGYLHALSDLRFARALLQRPDGGELHAEEREAVKEIDRAIGEIKRASVDDGKDLNDHPPVDAIPAWGGRLEKALESLRNARHHIEQEEDNAFAQGLQQRAFVHIDKAIHRVEDARRLVG